MSKVIIAGSRAITDYSLVSTIIDYLVLQNNIEVDEEVCGLAKGVDLLGKRWADEKGIPTKDFRPAWNDLNAPGAIIKENRYGKYNARAGHDRNELMAQYGDVLIVIWDGKSKGTADMIRRSKNHGLKIYEYVVNGA